MGRGVVFGRGHWDGYMLVLVHGHFDRLNVRPDGWRIADGMSG